MAIVHETCFSWVVCASSFFFQLMQGGLQYSMGIFYILLLDALNGTESSTALVCSLHFTMYCGSGLPVGFLITKFGERAMCILGAILLSLGLILSSQVQEVYHLYITYSFINGIGMGFTYVGSLSILDKYFYRHKALVSGVSTCGIGIGGLAFPPIIKLLADHYGWRGAFLLLGGINLHGIIVAMTFHPQSRGTHPPRNDDAKYCMESRSKSTTPTNHNKDNQEDRKTIINKCILLFKNVHFLSVCVNQTLMCFSLGFIYTHLGAYVKDLGYAGTDTVMIYTAMGAVSTISRVLSGLIAQIPCVNIFALCLTSCIVSGIMTVLLPLVNQLVVLYIFAVMFSVLSAPLNTLVLPMIAETIPKLLVPAGLGIMLLFCVPGAISGGPLTAYIYEVTNGYSASFFTAGAINFTAGLVLILPLCKSRCLDTGRSELDKEYTQVDVKA